MTNTTPAIDFMLSNQHRRRMLYYKRPAGTPIPIGEVWRCVCGEMHALNEQQEQYCDKCGSRLRLQENANPNDLYHTCVTVCHFNPARKPPTDQRS